MGTIIHLDNDEKILQDFKGLFDQSGINLDLVTCQTKDEFYKLIEEHKNSLKALVFDLLSSEPGKEELHKGDAEFLDSVEDSFSTVSIPIFIYSGFLEAIEEQFETHGTVFKIDKANGPDEILRLIKLFDESGFLDVFSPGGKIEKDFHNELNKSFISQFTNNKQIEEIINTVAEEDVKESKERVEKVFKRIALRSLLTVLQLSENEGDEEYLNPVEHYVKRINDQKIVTGDIFFSQEKNEHLLVMTPRCDLANKDPQEILVCNIDTEKFPDKTTSNTQKGKILNAITDNPEYSGYDRYLVRSPFFVGGLIKIGSYSMIAKEELLSSYDLQITLSDELTNEILGKFGSYFFRTGITTWDLDETVKFIESIKED
ncbi:MAG: hypothetical protein K9N46_01815 [Candidatus Marinimicrobia bacterium]|nr:hypothetical protein [Candidatus Neomarinimicrobiota bacterium]MCF7827786.1 hypothetical protein [Candidatus Neomarinimicrobiota bacterium]MCF7879459.1 hypothetical protein [Candidatus Neomarinimicrobiota bacterium]